MAKNKLPKKIAGFKLPKTLRKSRLLRSMLGSEQGQRILADALVAAATAAAAVLTGKSETAQAAGDKAVRGTRSAGRLAKEMAQSAASAVGDVLGAAAQAALPETSEKLRKRTQEPRGSTH